MVFYSVILMIIENRNGVKCFVHYQNILLKLYPRKSCEKRGQDFRIPAPCTRVPPVAIEWVLSWRVLFVCTVVNLEVLCCWQIWRRWCRWRRRRQCPALPRRLTINLSLMQVSLLSFYNSSSIQGLLDWEFHSATIISQVYITSTNYACHPYS